MMVMVSMKVSIRIYSNHFIVLIPHVTRESGGIGLGLAIVFNTVQQHQGYISAQKSELGGLSIEIRLPLWFD